MTPGFTGFFPHKEKVHQCLNKNDVCVSLYQRKGQRTENMEGMLNMLLQIVAVGCRMTLIRLMKQVRFLDIFICPERKGSKLPLVSTSAWKLWFAHSWRRCTHSLEGQTFFFFFLIFCRVSREMSPDL